METRVANRHILSSYDDELRRLERLILEMGGHCEELLAQALEALANRDADLAAEAIRHDIAIDALEREIEGLAVRLLALRQPMAVDLRQTLAALRMSSWLERVGDYAKN
ncbi:MAG: PhoU domain-containing protein, partial [Rhodospirillales bacterium]